jgi:hypothetical protein
MDPMVEVLDRMDAWRHLPNYQLERRADVFFSLYLAEVLGAKLGFAVRPELVPEFPVRISTIRPDDPDGDKSCKIDYLALSAANDKAVFVELKTDGQSRRGKQDEYLLAAQAAGLSSLLEGLRDIFRATNSKRKYFRLLELLERMGLLRIRTAMRKTMASPSLRGASELSRQIEVTAHVGKPVIVYVQPNGTGPDTISFREFAQTVRRHGDPVSQRFAASLCEWGDVRAGERLASK